MEKGLSMIGVVLSLGRILSARLVGPFSRNGGCTLDAHVRESRMPSTFVQNAYAQCDRGCMTLHVRELFEQHG